MAFKGYFIPSLFTFGNFFFGFLSIVKSYEMNLHAAAWYIVLAVICDGMDGRFARMYSRETVFGMELDSLGDLISSGIAPAVLIYSAVFYQMHILGIFICFLYVFAGGYRLARYNTIKQRMDVPGYLGIPLPIASLTLTGFWLFQFRLGYQILIGGWMILTLFIILLIVSVVDYDWPQWTFQGRFIRKLWSGTLVLLGLIVIIFPEWVLFPIFFIYILIGLIRWTITFGKDKISLKDLFIFEKY